MKRQKKLFGVLLLLLPIQLAFHFWPNWAYVWGVRIDYLAPTIYLTDILIFLILITAPKKKPKNFILPILIFIFLLINCFLAQNRGVAFYKLLKIVEFFLLGLYVSRSAYSLQLIVYSLPFAVLYSSLIAIGQFIKQGSLNGILWWLGERNFNLSQPGIARTVINGRLFLRPYATFPHPNALAGFFLVSLILTVPHLFYKHRLFTIFYSVLAILTIILSFSRSAWLVGVLIFFLVLFRRARNYFLLIGEAFGQRLILSQISLQLIKLKPIFGVGLNNFIVYLPSFWPSQEMVRLLQPVHNIFLLTAAETGIVGLIIFSLFLFLTFKKLLTANNQPFALALIAILLLGLFDHYWLTLQQNQLLFAIVLGLSWGSRRSLRV